MHDLLRYWKEFSGKGLLICFSGLFSQGIIEEIGNSVRRHLENEGVKKEVVTDIFAACIEQTQNIKNYLAGKKFPAASRNAIMTIARKNDRYILSFGNVIEKNDTGNLVKRIETVNSLDKAGLRSFYREQLRRGPSRRTGGAGLGLIDIARRASAKLAYLVQGIDGVCDFFILTVEI